jgi:hypothetical protein
VTFDFVPLWKFYPENPLAEVFQLSACPWTMTIIMFIRTISYKEGVVKDSIKATKCKFGQ